MIIIKRMMCLICFPDINECASAPCNNNGFCEELTNGFKCTCKPGYTGVNCETGNLDHFYLIAGMNDENNIMYNKFMISIIVAVNVHMFP